MSICRDTRTHFTARSAAAGEATSHCGAQSRLISADAVAWAAFQSEVDTVKVEKRQFDAVLSKLLSTAPKQVTPKRKRRKTAKAKAS
jgi:hypothetical protein